MREAEDDLQQVAAQQHGVEREQAGPHVADRHRERQHAIGVDDAADDVRALVAEEQRRQHVDLEIRRFVETAEFVVDRLHHARDVAREILERRLELEVRDDPLERDREPVGARIVRAVRRLRGRLVVLEVFGRDRRAHEDEVVVEIRPVQDLAAHRIEEGFRALGLAVRRQQADVMELDLLPDFVVDALRVVFVLQHLDALLHALVVRGDPLAREPLQPMPVGALEQRLRFDGRFAEDPVVAVEVLEHRLCDVEADLRRQQFGEVIHCVQARSKGAGDCSLQAPF
ncbi:hypothetical protein FEP01_05186 [Burkholderia multivorans]|nr:hypothetical protein [Burkholderia multivorans]